MKGQFASFLLLFLAASPVCSQLISSDQPAPDRVTLPFFPAGHSILLGATVDGREGFVILDTGAPMLILNAQHFSGSRDLSARQLVIGLDGPVQSTATTHATLQLGKLVWKNEYARLYDLTHLEDAKKVRILGLLGADLFRDFELIIDASAHQILLWRLDSQGSPLEPDAAFTAPDLVLPFKHKGHLPYVEAGVGDQRLRLGIDSGAGVAVLRRDQQARLRPFLEVAKTIRVRGIGGDSQALPTVWLHGLILGDLPFPPQKVVLTHLRAINQLLGGPELDGLLGFEFFRHYRIALNYRKREIRLWALPSSALPRMAGN